MLETLNDFLVDNRHIYLYIAIIGSAFFAVQIVLTFIGLGDADSVDAPGDEMGDFSIVGLFSFKAIVAFVTFFGWGGYLWGDLGISGLAIALICGFFMMCITALLIYFLLKLQQSGNISDEDFIGSHGSVYLTIPGGRSGGGLANVSVAGRRRQISAFSDEELASGEKIMVTAVLGDGTFLVEKQK